jgi:hypothetical protein
LRRLTGFVVPRRQSVAYIPILGIGRVVIWIDILLIIGGGWAAIAAAVLGAATVLSATLAMPFVNAAYPAVDDLGFLAVVI